jgi:hypothetical protein
LACAAVHGILAALAELDEDADRHGKSQSLARWIQRSDSMPPDAIEYEYEYSDAEYEYENRDTEDE